MRKSAAPSQRFSLHKGLIPKFTPVVRTDQIKSDPSAEKTGDCQSPAAETIKNEAQSIKPRSFSLASRAPLRAVDANNPAASGDASSPASTGGARTEGDVADVQIAHVDGNDANSKDGAGVSDVNVEGINENDEKRNEKTNVKTPSTVRRQPFQMKRALPSSLHPKLASHGAHAGGGAAVNAEEEGPELVYWECFWTKQSRKKHKTWSDGVLIVKGQTARLVKEDGEVATKSTVRCGSGLREGSMLFVGSFELELIKCITEDEWISKGADRAATQALAPPPSKLLSLSDKRPKFGGARRAMPAETMPAKGCGERQVASSEASDCSGAEPKPSKNYVIDPSRNGAHLLTAEDAQILVAVDPVLGLHFKPHQVEGVRFLYRSVMRSDHSAQINGCILADEMGLGKTLQSIALIWTLLKQSPASTTTPVMKKAVVVCPSSLVFNWASELRKWLGDQRAPTQTVMSGQGAKEAVSDFVNGNVKRVLVISYDMLRRHITALSKCLDVGLLVCDEGQRLKNIEGNKTIDALNAVPCSRRVLLSGTPIQNDLDEFYAMFSWVCPGLLGNPRQFRLVFADAITKSRDKGASADVKRVGKKRLKELNSRTRSYILRRTARSVADSLPAKFETLLFCRPSPLQQTIYRSLLSNKESRKAIEGGNGTVVLSLISKIIKVLNHPDLVRDAGAREKQEQEEEEGGCALSVDQRLFPDDYQPLDPAQSGKMLIVLEILSQIRQNTPDRVVVVSNYTTTLNILEKICEVAKFPCVRLDGSTEVSKRSGLVQTFNDPKSGGFVFLLSSKAGGCGLNLIGANRMILVDPSWNPAHDAQAMGRVWRFGQTKTCFIYRMLTTGTMEERIFQKQIRKGELESLVVDDGEDATCRHFDKSEIKNIFILRLETDCDTFELLSNSPEFEATERDNVKVVASYACYDNMQELPSLKAADPEVCFALAKHPGVVSFLMSKHQSPDDAKAPASREDRDLGDSDSGSDMDTAPQPPDMDAKGQLPRAQSDVLQQPPPGACMDIALDSDDDDFEVSSARVRRSRKNAESNAAQDAPGVAGRDSEQCESEGGEKGDGGVLRKRRRLIADDDSDSEG